MMKIQNGTIKYLNRDDIKCNFGITDEGKYYYFLEFYDYKKMMGNNIIATTNLLEAIDPELVKSHDKSFKAKNIGVINPEGKEIIPCQFGNIRPLSEEVLLAVLTEPVTPSVVEANQMRNSSDTTVTSKLVSISDFIKNRLNSKMSNEARYVFHDQCSEATIFDKDGKNLMNNNYYSYIAMDDTKIYCSKNTVDSEIVEYTIGPNKEVTSQVIDVRDVDVPKNIIENAEQVNTLTNDITASTMAIPVQSIAEEAEKKEIANETPQESVPTPVEETPQESVPASVEETPQESVPTPAEETPQESVPAPVEEVPQESVPSPLSDVTQEQITEPIEENKENVELPNEEVKPIEEEIDRVSAIEEVQEPEAKEDSVEEVEEIPQEDLVSFTSEKDFAPEEETEEQEEKTFDFAAEEIPDNYSEEEDIEATTLDHMVKDSFNKEEDPFKDYAIEEEQVDHIDHYDEADYNIIDNVTRTLSDMARQNRQLKTTLEDINTKYNKVSASRQNLSDKLTVYENKMGSLTKEIKQLQTMNAQLKGENESLKDKLYEQKQIIENQDRELEVVKPQVQSLSKVLADAQLLLGEDTNYNSYEEESYYSRSR